MIYEGIGNMEYHNFFTTPYGDPIEEAVLTEFSAFIENRFGAKVKKIALIDGRYGIHNRILQVFVYYYKDFLRLFIDGNRIIEQENSKIILDAAKEIISRHKAEKTFEFLNVVRIRCFEVEETNHIQKTIYLSQIEDLKSLLIDENIVRIYAPFPYSRLILFLRDNAYAEEFKTSEKCRRFHEMLYQKAKPLDTFGFIKDISDIKEAGWYFYDNEANYKPFKNMIQSYDDTRFSTSYEGARYQTE